MLIFRGVVESSEKWLNDSQMETEIIYSRESNVGYVWWHLAPCHWESPLARYHMWYEISHPPCGKKMRVKYPNVHVTFTGVECTNLVSWSFTLKVNCILVPLHLRSLFDAMPERELVLAHTTCTITSWVLESSDPHNLVVWGFMSKERPVYFLGVPSLKVLWTPENAPWKRETIYRPSSRGVQITRWANFAYAIGFPSALSPKIWSTYSWTVGMFSSQRWGCFAFIKGNHVSFPFPCDAGC